ncbi:HpcH/HpaI aldolase/citrate lyase family protein [Streptomyces sp. NPDC002018]|uniref:HpcH/HpaI aldolase/citrate lyase family protein n=1 Tax=Streptomyces sp. NPDC002018 TaxID=3364629 RepID=UPI00369EACC2
MPPRPPRSHLYVPADQPRFLRAARRGDADALILDLEDAVAPARKDDARAAAVAFALDRPATGGPELWVRVNTGARGLDDARALLATGRIDGLWMPKAAAGPEFDALAALVAGSGGRPAAGSSTAGPRAAAGSSIAGARAAAGPLVAGSVALGLLVESAAGVLTLGTVARHPVVRRIQLGEVDLRADLRMEPDSARGDDLLDWARGPAVAHAVAYGLECAVAPVSVHPSDRAAFRASSLRLRGLGFQGRACIHPDQVAVANEVFGTDAAELAGAHALLDLFERHERDGAGAFRDGEGAMADAATVRRARELTGRTAAAPAGSTGPADPPAPAAPTEPAAPAEPAVPSDAADAVGPDGAQAR